MLPPADVTVVAPPVAPATTVLRVRPERTVTLYSGPRGAPLYRVSAHTDFGGRLAIHGTDRPDLLGLPASEGCLRARDADLRWLMRTVPVGTLLKIRA